MKRQVEPRDRRMTLSLSESDIRAIKESAEKDLRHSRDQGVYLVRIGIEHEERIKELESACHHALTYFMAEWNAVAQHPSSRFRDEVKYYKEVLRQDFVE